MEYGHIIKRAWNITWRNKVLWIFGIAAALFTGGMRGGNSGSRGMQYSMGGDQMGRWRDFFPGMPMMPHGRFGPQLMPRIPGAELERLVPVIVAVLGVLAVVGLALFLIGLVVRYTSFGALIGMVNETEEDDSTSFKSGLRTGWQRFLHLLAISVLIGIGLVVVTLVFMIVLAIIGALVLAPGILLVASQGNATAPGILLIVGGAMVLALLVLIFSLVVSALKTVLLAYAYRVSVLDGKNVFDALKAAWNLVRARLRESLLMWLLLLAINLGLALLAIPLGLMAAGAMVGPAVAIYAATESIGGAILSALPVLLIVIAISLVIRGVYLTFRSAVWTLMFRELKSTEGITE
jgi:hypothetical protein